MLELESVSLAVIFTLLVATASVTSVLGVRASFVGDTNALTLIAVFVFSIVCAAIIVLCLAQNFGIPT